MDLQRVLVIGLPRSGTSIVASYLNSQPNALVVGEPSWPMLAGKDQIVYSRYGDIHLSHKMDIFEQLKNLSDQIGLQLIGMKEAWVPAVNAISIAQAYYDILDGIIITLREPRRNYLSMYYQFASIGPVAIAMFERHYKMLHQYGKNNDKVRFVILEQFKKDPFNVLQKAVPAIELEELTELSRYTGGGCRKARESTQVLEEETTGQSEQRFPVAELAYRFALKDVEKY